MLTGLIERILLTVEFALLRFPSKRTIVKPYDLVWILTSKEVDIRKKNPYNETRNRLLGGLQIARRISLLKINSYPYIFLNGYNEHNNFFKILKNQKYFEKSLNYPDSKILIGEDVGILHTDHQFSTFPTKLLKRFTTILLVTDAYQIPRVNRYLLKYQKKFKKSTLDILPSLPLNFKLERVRREIAKIIRYTKLGFFKPTK